MNEVKDIQLEGLAIPNADLAKAFSVLTDQFSLFDIQVSDLRKELIPKLLTNQGRRPGRVEHPIKMDAAIELKTLVTTQETCIGTKRDATVGLGFETAEEAKARKQKRELEDSLQQRAIGTLPGKPGKPSPKPAVKKELPVKPPTNDEGSGEEEPETKPKSKVEEILDPLCDDGFQALMNKLGDDFEDTGNAYMEVVRDEGGKILALWHMPSPKPYVVNEDTKPFRHFEVDDEQVGLLKYARFGEVDRVTKDVLKNSSGQSGQKQVTELIHFKMSTNRHSVYGLPSWTSAVPWLELAQMVMQYDFDYFQNRAVPDLMVLITGGQVADEDLRALKDALKETIGAKKRHRTVVANIPSPNLTTSVDRLAADNREKFSDLWSMVQLSIVSAHRVPPLLAGITLPGKMAAANELPNALVAFQTLYIAQNQKVFEHVLGRTLGSEEAGLGLKPTDFVLKKITDFFDMGQVDTMSRMRETATEAEMRGRELKDGLNE